ncbi:MAG: protein phosphatase 2C domain-containing protein [Bacillota bacterium]|nr:protein phosphatase 2C domain-containing protein [Bacillota bacterium]
MNKSTLKSNGDINSEPIKVQGCTDPGKIRSNNEDSFGSFIPTDINMREKYGSLFVISDGVGGSAAGEVASAEAVNVLLQEFYFGMYSERIPDRLRNAYQHTAVHIYDLACGTNPSLQNMKCTLSALLIRNDKFFISHVGDSKIFLIRKNKMVQLTKDHSLVGKLVRLGLISQEQARVHPNKNVLLKAIGDQPIMMADFYSGKVVPGDLFCLITDGILEHQTEEELKSFIEKDTSEEGLKSMISEMNNRGGYDNMTIMTVVVNNV